MKSPGNLCVLNFSIFRLKDLCQEIEVILCASSLNRLRLMHIKLKSQMFDCGDSMGN